MVSGTGSHVILRQQLDDGVVGSPRIVGQRQLAVPSAPARVVGGGCQDPLGHSQLGEVDEEVFTVAGGLVPSFSAPASTGGWLFLSDPRVYGLVRC